MHRFVVLVLFVAACGDNFEAPGVALPCIADEPPAPPHDGPFADPTLLPLPSSCVEGGLRDLPGRWFVNAPGKLFEFSYPKFEGSCGEGFRRSSWYEEDPEIDDDGFSFQTWSDGTRFYHRDYFTFGPDFEFANVFAACLRPNGTLAVLNGAYDTDRGARFSLATGSRFEPKDEGGSGLELVGELRGISGYNLVLDGTWIYMVGPEGFHVIDVADPAAPRRVGLVQGMWNDVKFIRTATKVVAYAAPIEDENTAIIDVTIPGGPVQVGQLLGAYSHSVFVTPHTTPPRLYLANYTESIPVYDLTNPTIPVLAASVPIAGTGEGAGIHDIHVDGTRIYADKTIDGMVAVDVASGFAAPTELGRLQTSYSHATWAGTVGGRKIAIHGDEGMTPSDGGAYLRVIDADETSPTFLQEIGSYQSRREVGIHNMVLVGDRAYIAYYQDGIRVLQLSDPTQPQEVAYYNTYDFEGSSGQPFEGALGLVVANDLVYVADNRRGLIILRITP